MTVTLYYTLVGNEPTFDKIVTGIEKAIEKGISLLIRTNIDPSNFDNFFDSSENHQLPD